MKTFKIDSRNIVKIFKIFLIFNIYIYIFSLFLYISFPKWDSFINGHYKFFHKNPLLLFQLFLLLFSYCFWQTDVTAALSNGETIPSRVSTFPQSAYMDWEQDIKNTVTLYISREFRLKIFSK